MTSYILVSLSMLTDPSSNAYMPTLLLFDAGNLEVIIRHREVRLHLLQRLIRDGVDSKLLLALSEVEPQLAPGRVPRSLAKEVGHLRAAIAARQGCVVSIVLRGHFGHYHRECAEIQKCKFFTMVGNMSFRTPRYCGADSIVYGQVNKLLGS